MEGKLSRQSSVGKEANVVKIFTRCLQAVLRDAHRKRECFNHRDLFRKLHSHDVILSFNYDLVAERALSARAKRLEAT